MVKVSVLIPTYNRKEKLARLIDSILASDFNKKDYEIIVVDDCSSDGTPDFIREKYGNLDNLVILAKEENKRKSNSINIGYKQSRGDYIFIIDDDTIVGKNTITDLLNHFINKGEKFVLSPLMYCFYEPEKIWFAGLMMNFWTTTGNFVHKDRIGASGLPTEIKTDGIVTSFMVPRKIFEEAGLFNEKLFPFQFEELDFCIRAKLSGYELLVKTCAPIWHDHEGGVFLSNPWRLYFEVRNRIVTAKLWSKNYPQSILAGISALIIPMTYIIIKAVVYRANYRQGIKSILKGIYDGKGMAWKLTPYYKRIPNDIKKDVC